MALARGLRIGDYVLLERLGIGAFGEVWRAGHVHLPRTVALKLARGERAVATLERETVAQFGLDHPGIVQVLDVHLSGEQPFAVLELVEGQSLRELLDARGRLEIADAAQVVRQVADALAYAHGRGIVHGDLKPENILIGRPGPGFGRGAEWQVRLTDFHVGRVAEASSERVPPPRAGDAGVRQSLCTRGPLGTYRYMAPEQERDPGAIDHRVDFYALGVVLFEMLTGSLPQGRDLPSDVNPQVSWWWDHIFSRCYTGRERRYRVAAELLVDIEAASGGPRWGELPSQRAAAAAASTAGTLPPAGAIAEAVRATRADLADGRAASVHAGACARTAAPRGRPQPPRLPPPPRPAVPGLTVLVLGALAIAAPLSVLRTLAPRPDRGRPVRCGSADPVSLRGAAPAPAPQRARPEATQGQAQGIFRAYVDVRRHRDDPLGARHKVDLTRQAEHLRGRLGELGYRLQDEYDLDAERYTVELWGPSGGPVVRAAWRPLGEVQWTWPPAAPATRAAAEADADADAEAPRATPRLFGTLPREATPVR